jgi:hypothetical protein
VEFGHADADAARAPILGADGVLHARLLWVLAVEGPRQVVAGVDHAGRVVKDSLGTVDGEL